MYNFQHLSLSSNNSVINIVKPSIERDRGGAKGSEARTVLLNAQAQEELRVYAKTLSRSGDETLFVSKWGKAMSPNSLVQVFGRFYKLAGLSNASSHSGRRSFITTLSSKGVNVRVLATLAGPKNITRTQRYIEVGEHQLREAAEMARMVYRKKQGGRSWLPKFNGNSVYGMRKCTNNL